MSRIFRIAILSLCSLALKPSGLAAVGEGQVPAQNAISSEEANGVKLNTAHYILYIEKLDPAETSRIAEAAYEQLKQFFTFEPDRKIQIKIFANQRRYQSEIDRLRTVFNLRKKARDAIGTYYRETACCYSYVQPKDYENRMVLLHEITHAYNDFIRSWRYVPSLDFCDEGIAEHFAQHNWDGQTLQIGVVPPISGFDLPRAALHQLHDTLRFDLQSVVSGDSALDYPLAWGLVSFLIDQHRAQFNIWRQGINNDVEPRVVWQKQFGAVTPEFLKGLETWLEAQAPPWQIIKGDWCPWGPSLQGLALEDDSAVAILNRTRGALAVSWEPVHSNTVAGVAFGFRGAKSYYALERHTDGPWELQHYLAGFVERADRQSFPSAEGAPAVTVEPGEHATTVRFDNHTLSLTNVVGPIGLWVKTGMARFRAH